MAVICPSSHRSGWSPQRDPSDGEDVVGEQLEDDKVFVSNPAGVGDSLSTARTKMATTPLQEEMVIAITMVTASMRDIVVS